MTKDKLLKRLSRVANFILGGGGAFCVLAWLYFAYYFWWTKTRVLSNLVVAMATYYVLPAILAILLFASLRLKPAYKINVALSCLSLFAAIYATEILLPSIAATFGLKPDDTRTLLEAVIDLQKIGVDAVPAMAPMFTFSREQDDGTRRSFFNINGAEVFPLAGVANKFTVFCNERGEYTNYESDEHGFNNPSGIWKSNTLDIAIVGDSFTHGYCVPADTQFVSLIRKQYPSTLNLGMVGNGPLVELATLREFLPPFRPKIVLWVYFEGNDYSELREERKRPS